MNHRLLRRLLKFVGEDTCRECSRHSSKLRFEELEARQMLTVSIDSLGIDLRSSSVDFVSSSVASYSSPTSESIDVSSVSSEPGFDEIYSQISSIEFENDDEQETAEILADAYLNGQPLRKFNLGLYKADAELLSDHSPALVDLNSYSNVYDVDGGGYGDGGSSGGGSSGGGNEQPENISLSISAQTTNASHFQSSSLPNAVVESYSCRYTGFDLSQVDYVTVTLPPLPDEHYLEVNLSGTATPEVDYELYIAEGSPIVRRLTPRSDNSFYYEGNSGGTTYLYLVPINNYVINEDKSVIVSLGKLNSWNSGGGDIDYDFDVRQVSATIVDDDQWKVTLRESGENGEVVLSDEEGSTHDARPVEISESPSGGATSTYFTLTREDAGANRFGDLSYPIVAGLTFDGQATTDDFSLCYYDVDLSIWRECYWGRTEDGSYKTVVNIPTGFNDIHLRVSSIDDQVIERLNETLNISLSSASNLYVASFAVEQEGGNFVIKDDDRLTLNQLSFKNNLNLISDTLDRTRDTDIDTAGVMDLTSPGNTLYINSPSFGVSWQAGPHWFKDTTQNNLPVAYACDDNLKCDAVTSGIIAPDVTLKMRAKIQYDDRTYVTPWQARTSANAQELTFTETFLDVFQNRQAYYDASFTINWEFVIVGDDEETEVREFSDEGKSDIILYVTYNRPNVGELYHTIVHTGCVAASEIQTPDTSDPEAVFDAIWASFASRNIPKVKLINGQVQEGRALSYYGRELPQNMNKTELVLDHYSNNNLSLRPYNSIELTQDITDNGFVDDRYQVITYARAFQNYGLRGFLVTGDGSCGTWQDFALRVYYAQGFGVTTQSQTTDGFETYNITINNDNHSEYADGVFKVTTLEGQGGGVPNEFIWPDHALIKYGNTILDPSYGLRFDFGEGDSYANEGAVKRAILISYLDCLGRTEEYLVNGRYKYKLTDKLQVSNENYVRVLSCFSFTTSLRTYL